MNRKEAIEHIKWYFTEDDGMAADASVKEAIQALVPELNESEDERILASLAHCVSLMGEDGTVFSSHNVTKERVLSWIEKQKEQKPINWTELNGNEDERIRKHIINILGNNTDAHEEGWAVYADEIAWLKKQKEQSMELLEPDKNVEKIIEDIIRVYGKTQGEWIGGYDIDTLIINLRRAFKQKEHNPEWSKEDEETLACVISVFEDFAESKNVSVPPASAKRYLKRLKSIHPQLRQEWSDEDKLHLNNAILAAEKEWGTGSYTVKFLKTLLFYPRPKPVLSKENMLDELRHYLDTSPREQHKQVREEIEKWYKATFIQDEPSADQKPAGTWKPTKEQLESLNVASYGGTLSPEDMLNLVSLLKDLDKLLA